MSSSSGGYAGSQVMSPWNSVPLQKEDEPNPPNSRIPLGPGLPEINLEDELGSIMEEAEAVAARAGEGTDRESAPGPLPFGTALSFESAGQLARASAQNTGFSQNELPDEKRRATCADSSNPLVPLDTKRGATLAGGNIHNFDFSGDVYGTRRQDESPAPYGPIDTKRLLDQGGASAFFRPEGLSQNFDRPPSAVPVGDEYEAGTPQGSKRSLASPDKNELRTQVERLRLQLQAQKVQNQTHQ